MERYNAVYIGSMRLGEPGVWGPIVSDRVEQLQKHRVSFLTRPQSEEYYGDKDVLHEQLVVEDQWDENVIPPDFHTSFDVSRSPYYYDRYYNDQYWFGDGRFFVQYMVTRANTIPSPYSGCFMPAGMLRGIVEAYRVVERNHSFYFQELSWTYPSDHSDYDSGGHLIDGFTLPEAVFDENIYSVASETVIYDYYSGWNTSWLGPNNPVPLNNAKRIPTIPYYWRDWMWQNHPPTPVTDYEAYSECYRNTVARVTQSGMNNIANIMEVASTIKAIKDGKITELFSSLRDFLEKRGAKEGWKLAQDSWLKYRYVYGTTKADADAAVDYFLDEKWKTLTDRKVVRGSIGLSDGQLRLKMRLRESADLSLQLRTDLKSVGLFPDLYTLWDLVPYSFVVDWIVPSFSNELEDLSQAYLSSAYDVQELLVTRKHEWIIHYAGFDYHCKSYSRTFDHEPPQFEFYEESSNPKKKTVIKRIFDGIALFIK